MTATQIEKEKIQQELLDAFAHKRNKSNWKECKEDMDDSFLDKLDYAQTNSLSELALIAANKVLKEREEKEEWKRTSNSFQNAIPAIFADVEKYCGLHHLDEDDLRIFRNIKQKYLGTQPEKGDG